jgi:hypothetical protein
MQLAGEQELAMPYLPVFIHFHLAGFDLWKLIHV